MYLKLSADDESFLFDKEGSKLYNYVIKFTAISQIYHIFAV